MSLDALAAACPTCRAALASRDEADSCIMLTYECGAVGLISEDAAKAGRLWEVRWSQPCPAPQRAREDAFAEAAAERLDPAITDPPPADASGKPRRR